MLSFFMLIQCMKPLNGFEPPNTQSFDDMVDNLLRDTVVCACQFTGEVRHSYCPLA